MHSTASDDACALHRATRTRKNHTSRRAAFETIGNDPLGTVTYDSLEVSFRRSYTHREATELAIHPDLNPNVDLVKFTPGMDPTVLEASADSAGVIIEGTGLGHVHTDLIPTIETLVTTDVPVVMTSQCIEGRICDRVYDTGRDLLDAGVIEGGDMLPGTAKVKLMWVLANASDTRQAMRTPLNGEILPVSRPWT